MSHSKTKQALVQVGNLKIRSFGKINFGIHKKSKDHYLDK